MSLECWQTNILSHLAENCPSLMLNNKQSQQYRNETFGLSCVQRFCVLSSHRMEIWWPILLDRPSHWDLDYTTHNELLPSALLHFCVVLWDLVMYFWGGKPWMCWGWSIKESGTTRHLHCGLSASQTGASSSLKHIKMTYKILVPRTLHSMKMLWYFNILSQVIMETNTELLEIPVEWNSCEVHFCT